MRLAVVVQRYGPAINGGAELHARYVAEHLARHHEVEVCTTCAADYVTWRNELPPGVETVNGITVRRFPVSHERNPETFGRRSQQVFAHPHSLAQELAWLDAEGPASRALVRYVRRHAADYDYWIFFSYRYHHAYHGVRAAAPRAILVPTAERDAAIGLSIFPPVFRGVRALMYNSPEERALIQAAAHNDDVPSVVVGIGSDVPANPQSGRFRQKYNIRSPFAVYIGRIDENKGCKELFEYFAEYARRPDSRLTLVLVGNSILPVPDHPRIRHVGFLDDGDKFDALAAAELLIMPSYFESLSMVALEAWGLGKPVLANARCDVLQGQCLRSNAGLCYEGAAEFVEMLLAIERNRWLSVSLGRNGRQFFREHYDWPVIERKYLDMLDRLAKEPAASRLEPLPGWLARHARTCQAASEVLAALPSGPASGGPAPDRPAFEATRSGAQALPPSERLPVRQGPAPRGRPNGHRQRGRPHQRPSTGTRARRGRS